MSEQNQSSSSPPPKSQQTYTSRHQSCLFKVYDWTLRYTLRLMCVLQLFFGLYFIIVPMITDVSKQPHLGNFDEESVSYSKLSMLINGAMDISVAIAGQICLMFGNMKALMVFLLLSTVDLSTTLLGVLWFPFRATSILWSITITSLIILHIFNDGTCSKLRDKQESKK